MKIRFACKFNASRSYLDLGFCGLWWDNEDQALITKWFGAVKTHYGLWSKVQTFNAHLVYPLLKITGFRFSKAYRHGYTRYHRIVYFLVDTVQANILAGLGENE